MTNFDNLILKIKKGETVGSDDLKALFNNLDQRLKELEKFKMKLALM